VATLDVSTAVRALHGAGGGIPDAKLADIVALTQRADHAGAASRARAALDSGCSDVRVLMPFLFGVFDDRGPDALGSIFDVVRLALTDAFAIVRPEARKVAIVDSAVSGLLRAVVANIDFHEKTQSARYLAWASQGALSAGSASLEASAELRPAITRALGGPRRDARSATQLSELEARIRVHFSRVPLAPPPEPPDEDDEPAGAPDLPDDHGGRSALAAPARPAPAAAPAGAMVEVSPAMERFMASLDAFASLIDRGDVARAAIVADDIRRTTEAFDPKKYFPKLLLPYLRLQARHVQDLVATRESMDSGTWSALEQLYQADLDAFLAE